MNKKNKLISLLASIGCVALSAGVGAQFTMAQAEGKTIGNVDVSSFRMSYGAEMRFDPNNTEDPIGIRFSATLADKAYEDLEKLDGVNYGMVIVPADIVKNKPLTEENLFGQDALYCFEDPKQGEETEGCTCSKQHVASVEYAVLSNAKKDDGVRNLRGSLVNILPANLTREYVGLGYIEYNGAYVLADYAYGENDQVSDIKNNTRSVTYVAQRAIDNNQDDADETLKETFVDTQSGKQFKYTVNHYLPKEEGGYTTVTETLGGTLGAEVTATHITKGNLAADYKAYKLYNMSAQGNTKDVLYANGRTTLNCYYEKMDTTWLNCDPTELSNVDNQYTYLEYANRNDPNTKEMETYESFEIGGETRQGVTMIKIGGENNGYYSGYLNLALPLAASDAGSMIWDYIKVSLAVVVENGETNLKMGSFNKSVGTIEAGKWQELYISKSELNQYSTAVISNNPAMESSEEFYLKFANTYNRWSTTGFLNCFSVTNGYNAETGTTSGSDNVDESKGHTDTVTYYIDKIEWGVDTQGPDITVTGVGEEMFEGTFTEPTVTVTDDYTLVQSEIAKGVKRNMPVTKTLYKVDGETRTPIEFTDGKVDLTKGDYVYVVTADDSAIEGEVGNVSVVEKYFEVVEKQDVVITFDSSDDTKYFSANTAKTYDFTTSYLTADELAAEGLNAGAIDLEGGAIKIATGTEGTNAWGAWLKLNLSSDEIALVSDATTITFRMYVHVGDYTNWPNTTVGCEVDLLDGGQGSAHLAGSDKDAWNDVTVTVADLKKALTTYLDGTNCLFWVGSTTVKGGSTVTYYINSITFDVTP